MKYPIAPIEHGIEDSLRGASGMFRRIKNFNQIFRRFAGEILEINQHQTGSNRYEVTRGEKAMKVQGIMGVCTAEAGQCIQ